MGITRAVRAQKDGEKRYFDLYLFVLVTGGTSLGIGDLGSWSLQNEVISIYL